MPNSTHNMLAKMHGLSIAATKAAPLVSKTNDEFTAAQSAPVQVQNVCLNKASLNMEDVMRNLINSTRKGDPNLTPK